jgi:hypothetical protein
MYGEYHIALESQGQKCHIITKSVLYSKRKTGATPYPCKQQNYKTFRGKASKNTNHMHVNKNKMNNLS